MLVEDKPPQPLGRRVQPGCLGRPPCPLSRPGSLSHTRIAVLARLTGGSRPGLHQARRGRPQVWRQGGGGCLGHLVAASGRPHSLHKRVAGGRTGPAPAPAAQSTRGHGRSSAVAFDGTPATPGCHLNPRREPPTPTRGVGPRPSPRWMHHPGHRPGDSEAGRGVHDPQSPQTRAAGGWAPCPDSSYQRGARSRHVRRGARRQGCRRDGECTPADLRVWLPVFEIPAPLGGRQLGLRLALDLGDQVAHPPPRLVERGHQPRGAGPRAASARPPPSRPPTRPT